MPRKSRTKPVEDHLSSTARAQTDPAPAELAPGGSLPFEEPAAREPDIFDQVIAARAAGQFETPPQPATPDTTARIETALASAPVVRASELIDAPGSEQALADRLAPRTVLPNPRGIDQISLEADDRNGPKMRLLRFRHTRGNGQDVWIQFDKNPGKDVTESVKTAGFRWERDAMVGDHKGAWVMELRPGREVRMMLDAERLFKELGNTIRQTNGLAPVGMVGVGAD